MQSRISRVVLLGTRPACLHALQILQATSRVQIQALVTRPISKESKPYWEEKLIEQAKNFEIKVIESTEDLELDEFDFALSVNYWKKIPESFIKRSRFGVVNLHHSFNLSIKGRMCATRAIQACEEDKLNFTGSSIHYINEHLDAGPIIQSLPCLIHNTDTAYEVFQNTERLGKNLLETWLPILPFRKVPAYLPDNSLNQFYLVGKNLTRFKRELFNNPLSFFNIVRSYEFRDLFEPAFFENNSGNKEYLTTSKTNQSSLILVIDDMRKIYTHF